LSYGGGAVHQKIEFIKGHLAFTVPEVAGLSRASITFFGTKRRRGKEERSVMQAESLN